MAQTEKDTTTCSVSPRTEEVKQYACGHKGPVLWDFLLFGNIHKINDDLVKNSGKCGQCHLDEIVPTLAQCAKCKVAISPDQDCIQYDGELCCLKREHGDLFAGVPGIWDGKQFVDGVVAGTIVTIKSRWQ